MYKITTILEAAKINCTGRSPEPAEFCLIPWAAVFKEEEITNRVPAYQVMVSYE
jgi:hypothetical protein